MKKTTKPKVCFADPCMEELCVIYSNSLLTYFDVGAKNTHNQRNSTVHDSFDTETTSTADEIMTEYSNTSLITKSSSNFSTRYSRSTTNEVTNSTKNHTKSITASGTVAITTINIRTSKLSIPSCKSFLWLILNASCFEIT